MPYRRVPTDRAGLSRAAVQASAAALLGLARCQGVISETRTAPVGTEITETRPCPVRLDPVLTAAGFTTHPNCRPGEISPGCPPLPWPAWMLGGDPADTRLVRWEGDTR